MIAGPAPWPVAEDELVAAHCHFGADHVRGDREATDFKRRARWQQRWWREAQGLPMGHNPVPGGGERPNGSRIPLEAALVDGSNLLSAEIVQAVHQRIERPQRHQMLDEARLWSDLLSSMPMCFNLFGEAAVDDGRLAAAVDALWPDHPSVASELIFEWSPGRRDCDYLSNRTAFDAAVLLDLGGEERGVIGIETKYHEHMKRERTPHEQRRLPRYREVTEQSGIFKAGWEAEVVGTDLQQIWLDHLLVLAMLQHPTERWAWGRLVLVHPAANGNVAAAADRYRAVLADDATFSTRTIEQLLEPGVLHQTTTAEAFSDRYLWPAAGDSSAGMARSLIAAPPHGGRLLRSLVQGDAEGVLQGGER